MRNTPTSQLEFDGVAATSEAQRDDPNPATRTDLDSPTGANSPTGRVPREIVRRPRGKPSPRTGDFGGQPLATEALLNFAEAARLLGISLRQFRRLVDGGKVAFVKVSERSPRVRPSELQRFLDASAVKYEVAS